MGVRRYSGSMVAVFLAFSFGSACNCGSPAKGASDAGDGGHATSGTGSSGATAGGGGCGLVTCASAKANCGALGDGCGDIIQCGTCPAGQSCGAAGPNVCGGGATGGSAGSAGGSGGSGGAPCTGLCTQQVACSGGGTTSLSGTVYAATNPANGFGNPDPLPNVLVYVPNGTVEPFTEGVTCDACGAPVTGDPLVSTVSGDDGTFTLDNVPAGSNIPLVIQIGRWRRQITIPTVTACTNTQLTPDQTRMPRNHTEGDIPLIAMVTGSVDSIECVLRKMGIDDSEFTTPSGGGRVQIYVGNGSTDATSSAPGEESLVSSPTTLGDYDLVVFACVGSEQQQAQADQQNVIDYANAGGRVYATHYSYVWLFNDTPFSGTADWDVNKGTQTGPESLDINTSFSRGAQLARWLQVVGASTTYGVIPLGVLRNDFTASVPPSETWLYWDGGTPGGGGNGGFTGGHTGGGNGGGGGDTTWDGPVHYTFDTPVGADPSAQCGRVVFSDFHVENNNGDTGSVFPAECGSAAPMTPQEKVLEFMLFDLSSCVLTSTPTGSCVPQTCSQLGYNCGMAGDGCGGTIDCGGGSSCFEGANCGCGDGGTCGGAGQANVCGTSQQFH
ncbi:MAG TPA: hypothetical protein VMB50_08660 [Myxococcales bacterium]|nr:hypothetical protein [Myxococcales bacterium]